MNLEELVENYGLLFCEEYYSQFIEWCKNSGYVNEDFEEDE